MATANRGFCPGERLWNISLIFSAEVLKRVAVTTPKQASLLFAGAIAGLVVSGGVVTVATVLTGLLSGGLPLGALVVRLGIGETILVGVLLLLLVTMMLLEICEADG